MLAKTLINRFSVLLVVGARYGALFHWLGPSLIGYYRKVTLKRREYDREIREISTEPDEPA